MLHVTVIDGQGGGIGRTLVLRLRRRFGGQVTITAAGTNAAATAAMMSAGADMGATGENAVAYCAHRADFVMGTMGIIVADAMLGEITPTMACAIARSEAKKILIPMNRCGVLVAGVREEPIDAHITAAIAILEDALARRTANSGEGFAPSAL